MKRKTISGFLVFVLTICIVACAEPEKSDAEKNELSSHETQKANEQPVVFDAEKFVQLSIESDGMGTGFAEVVIHRDVFIDEIEQVREKYGDEAAALAQEIIETASVNVFSRDHEGILQEGDEVSCFIDTHDLDCKAAGMEFSVRNISMDVENVPKYISSMKNKDLSFIHKESEERIRESLLKTKLDFTNNAVIPKTVVDENQDYTYEVKVIDQYFIYNPDKKYRRNFDENKLYIIGEIKGIPLHDGVEPITKYIKVEADNIFHSTNVGWASKMGIFENDVSRPYDDLFTVQSEIEEIDWDGWTLEHTGV